MSPSSIADLLGFVDFLAGQADVGGGGIVLLRNNGVLVASFAAGLLNLAPLLRGIVFVGKAALRQRLDFQRVGLRAECGDVTRLLSAIVVRAPIIFSFC